MNIKKRIYAAIVCIFALIFILPMNFEGSAAQLESERTASLSITLAPDGKPLEGAKYSMYKIADASSDMHFTLLKTYDDAKLSIDINDPSAENRRLLATTLNGYVAAKSIMPVKTVTTDENGTALFDDMDCGLYLVKGAPILYGGEYIIPTPFIISLPETDGDNNRLYDISVDAKYTTKPEGEDVFIQVLKVWYDESGEAHPHEVTVQLFDENKLYDTVVLNKDNNWQFYWNDLPMGDWSIYEKDIPSGYLICIEQQLHRYVVANSSPPDDEPSSEKATDPEETTTLPAEATTEYDKTTLPEETTTGTDEATTASEYESTTLPPPDEPKLPDTGQLWWPVPLLSLAGLVFVMFGIISRKSEDE